VILLGSTCSCCHAEKRSWADIAAAPPLAPVATVGIDDRKTVLTPLHPKTTTNLPPGVYKSLPANAIKASVRNVYDGDTLTLVDGRRVRFLGIDTPELDPPQAFGPEAKAYTKELCHKQDVYLDVQKGTDKYGRLLAFVWVSHGTNGHYLNVNEGLVAQGLASVYTSPRRKTKRRFPTLPDCWNINNWHSRQEKEFGTSLWNAMSSSRNLDRPIIFRRVDIWPSRAIHESYPRPKPSVMDCMLVDPVWRMKCRGEKGHTTIYRFVYKIA